jgi:hypothetical protein
MRIEDRKVKLPEPDPVENKWVKIPRASNTVPWGYKVSEEDDYILEPIPEQLFLLEQAKEHLKNYSYRAVAEWLSEATGNYISHMGLRERIKREQTNRRRANGYYSAAKSLQKTLEALRKLEEESLGSTNEPSRANEFEYLLDSSDRETGSN